MSKKIIGSFVLGFILGGLTTTMVLAKVPEPQLAEQEWCLVAEYSSLEDMRTHNTHPHVLVKFNGTKVLVHTKCE